MRKSKTQNKQKESNNKKKIRAKINEIETKKITKQKTGSLKKKD
jgi:hypothetical protein